MRRQQVAFNGMLKRHQQNDGDKSTKKKSKRGLKTAINPILLSSNLNLVSKQYRNQNPYLSTTDQHEANDKITRRYERGLKFHDKGEISSQIEKQRLEEARELAIQSEKEIIERQRREEQAKERLIKILAGELPDDSVGEDKYIKQIEDVPKVEWWDRVYLDDDMHIRKKYFEDQKDVDSDDESDDEERFGPSIRYVHHPVPVQTNNSKNVVAKVYLTKNEQKKIRRNRRKLLREEKETRVKLGVDPKPEPKVRLSNMMSVYEHNSNIVDPTKWEQTVKEQVESRRQKHIQENENRHKEALELRKSKKADESSNIYCQVFRFKKLTNPKIRYKIKMNASQLGLKGTCLRIGDQGSGIIIIVGKEKSCRFFNKLVTKRIKWDENYEDRDTKTVADMTGNYCKQVWEGYSNDLKFPNLFMKVCEDESDLLHTLQQFNAQSFISAFKQSS